MMVASILGLVIQAYVLGYSICADISTRPAESRRQRVLGSKGCFTVFGETDFVAAIRRASSLLSKLAA
jgi:2-keto-4-pentenoate hydratase/2-oxohepta-3-ene-1,7-dioic acid hydratase in catechol pathway